MFDIGFMELLLISVIALLVLGPEKLPHAVRTAALWIGRARRSFNKVKSEIEQQLNTDEIRRQLHNESILKDLEQAKKQAADLASETRKSLDELGDEVSGAVGGVTGKGNETKKAEKQTEEEANSALDKERVQSAADDPSQLDEENAPAALNDRKTPAAPVSAEEPAPAAADKAKAAAADKDTTGAAVQAANISTDAASGSSIVHTEPAAAADTSSHSAKASGEAVEDPHRMTADKKPGSAQQQREDVEEAQQEAEEAQQEAEEAQHTDEDKAEPVTDFYNNPGSNIVQVKGSDFHAIDVSVPPHRDAASVKKHKQKAATQKAKPAGNSKAGKNTNESQ